MSPPDDWHEALARTTLLVRSDFYPEASETDIVDSFTESLVCIRSDDRSAATVAGQTAITTTALICAQLGARVVLDIPDEELIAPQPPLQGPGLRTALLELLADLIVPGEEGGAGDFTVLVGASAQHREPPERMVRITGDEWSFSLDSSPTGPSWKGTAPFGPLLAASAAGAEVFRFLLRRFGRVNGFAPLREHRVGAPHAVKFALPPLAGNRFAVDAVDAVSAGALTTAALYALLRVPGVEGDARLIDFDTAALSNLNRYLLFRQMLLSQPKVTALASFATDRLRLHPCQARLDEDSLAEILPLADRVVIGVDDIPSRWRAQKHAPRWVGVAATSHLEVVVSEHEPSSACAGCLHSHDDEGPPQDIPTVSFVSALAGFLLAYRLIREAVHGSEPSATLAYPFNLAAPLAFQAIPLAPRHACPVGCSASAAFVSARK